jgi:rhodanese-related sulfurtransferase
MRRFIAIVFSSAVLLVGLAACAPSADNADSSKTVQVNEDTVLIDVRSAEEFNAGHLEGATLLDFNAGDLAAAIPSLDPKAEYLVYCRSGNRSAQAIAAMQQAGFSNLTNLGSLEEAASATKLPTVQ